MAGVTKVNPTAVALGTIQRNTQTSVFKVVFDGAGLATMSNAAGAAKVTDACGSFAGIIQAVDADTLILVGDRHAVDINAIATTIAQVVDTGTFTVAAGVATLSDTNAITVTEPTTFVDIVTS
jgi:predicted transcriptional regulator